MLLGISKSSKFYSALALALLIANALPALAQDLGQAQAQALGQAIGLADLSRQLREAGQLMDDYAKKHEHFPNSISEFDELLRQLYKKTSMTDPDSTVQVQSNGKFRTFYQFAICVDPSYKSIPVVNGVAKIPDYYTAPGPGMIVITTDGDDGCVGWISGTDNKPLTSSGPNPLYFEAAIPKKDEGK